MRVYAFTCGWLASDIGMFIAGESGRIKVPVPSFLIEHPQGRVLFDTGLHPDAAVDAERRLGSLVAGLFEVDFPAGTDVASRLEALEVDPSRVAYLVNSHLHFDHSGGNALVPNARLVVQRREWEAGHDDDAIRRNTYNPADYRLGHDVLAVDGEHDLFGDGTVVCVPTYGHTPGHQSLRVRTRDGDVVLCADACYLRRTLARMVLPSVVADREQMLASLRRLRGFEAGGARLIFGHDPELWQTLSLAPLPL